MMPKAQQCYSKYEEDSKLPEQPTPTSQHEATVLRQAASYADAYCHSLKGC